MVLSSAWEVVLRALNRTPFGVADPIFSRDVGFYVFTLPALSTALGFFSGLAAISFFLVLPVYWLRGDLIFRHRRLRAEPSAGLHLAILLAVMFGLTALRLLLVDAPNLLYSTTGPLVGASYTDLHARLPAYRISAVVALVAAAAYVSTDDILNSGGDPPLIVVLDGVEDPRNFGAILRVADGAGADGVVIPERRAVGLTDTVAKASAGAIEHVKVAKTQNLNRFIEELKARDIWVVGASDQAEIHYTAWDWMRPSALVLGGEGSGLHRLVAENCDMLVKIPMYGKIDSLNVSVAAGVILFEARRQRGAM